MAVDKVYWFPAKRYGWGWGLPSCWQGWLVLVLYVLALLVIARVFPPTQNIGHFLLGMVIATVVFVAICWFTGEPPGWRWGG